jgi:hypothetical protein
VSLTLLIAIIFINIIHRSIRVTEDGIYIYALPDDEKPCMTFLKKDTQIFSDLKNRRFRLFRYVNTIYFILKKKLIFIFSC